MSKSFLVCFFCITTALFLSMSGPDCSASDGILWTDEELLFIKNHPVIHLGVDPGFVPFEFIDNNKEYKGIAKDYLSLVSQRTGIVFKIRKGLTWPEAYDLALAGEVDALPAIGKTSEREKCFIFSEPYYNFKRVIVTAEKDKRISGICDLKNTMVAVQRNSSHHSYLLSYDLNLSLYDSVESALVAVSTGSEKAFIGNLAASDYLIRTNGLTNLRLVSFEAEKQQSLYFAARKDLPPLVSIFNKAVADISSSEKKEIKDRWVSLETKYDYGPVIRMVLLAAAFFTLVSAVSFFWALRLRKEVKRRKRIYKELEKANLEAEEANLKLKEANEELKRVSMLDGLTGVANRRCFDTFLQKYWGINKREQFPLALMMIDIDRFKQYNDRYGHLAGDVCLKGVADVISHIVKRPGDFVTRYGGEEFAVLLTNTSEQGAAELAEQIRNDVAETSIDNGVALTHVTVSIGVASMVSLDHINAEDLIIAADKALYAAKNTGRNRVVKNSSISGQ